MESFEMPNTAQGNVQVDANGLTPEDHQVLQQMDQRASGKPPVISTETAQGSTETLATGENPSEKPSEAPAPSKEEIPWEKRYKDLEKAFQKSQDELKRLSSGKPPAPEAPPAPPADATALVTKALEESLGEAKAISEDTYKALEAAGRSRHEVDMYVEGAKAKADGIRRDVLSVIDSDLKTAEQDYSKMLEWARANYSPEDAAEFDRAMTDRGTNATRMKQQVELLKNRFIRANGTPSTGHINGSHNGSSAGALFANSNELRAAMQNPKYGRDAFYTDEVDAKALRSQMAGRI